jgi:hypothetical protein
MLKSKPASVSLPVAQDENSKQCSTCLQMLSMNAFYTKGNRVDSRCKPGSKSRKRSTYVPKKEKYSGSRVKNALELLIDFEMNQLETLHQKIREAIQKC